MRFPEAFSSSNLPYTMNYKGSWVLSISVTATGRVGEGFWVLVHAWCNRVAAASIPLLEAAHGSLCELLCMFLLLEAGCVIFHIYFVIKPLNMIFVCLHVLQ